jgi:site-specific recombinase XerD
MPNLASALKQARAEGYSRSTLERIAWVLLIVAEAVQSHGGSISSARLKGLLCRRIRLGNGRPPSEHTAGLLRRFGEDWLRSIGALLPGDDWPLRFARELSAFTEHMRVERGLSPVTIATREERMRWFIASLPSRVRSLGDVTISQIDAFLDGESQRGWSRSSLHALGSSLRSFFRFAAQHGWCEANLALSIDLPCLYALSDVPKALTIDEVNQLLEATATSNDPVTIRNHAVLSLLIHYGLRRGEVERLTLDDIDWVAEMLHVTRPKLRRPQCYPLSAPVGDAILRYLRETRPQCSHRVVFLTIKAPFRPLSGASISAM